MDLQVDLLGLVDPSGLVDVQGVVDSRRLIEDVNERGEKGTYLVDLQGGVDPREVIEFQRALDVQWVVVVSCLNKKHVGLDQRRMDTRHLRARMAHKNCTLTST